MDIALVLQGQSAEMDERKIGLTIFLLRQDREEAFQKKVVDQHPSSIVLSAPLDGFFLPFPSIDGRQPDWVQSVGSLLTSAIGSDMAAKSPGGLLVIKHSGRIFILSFGHAWRRLEDDWLERDFGLRVTLNVIPKDRVVEIKSEQVFAKWHLASERAPRAASVDEFGIDFDRDLVAVVEGVPKNAPTLGGTVRGSTSLHLNLPVTELEAVFDVGLKQFASNAYKKDWPDIDKINPVRDRMMIELLEDQLNTALDDEKARGRMVMFTPSQRRGDSVLADSYVYGRNVQSAASSTYLTIDGWLSYLAHKKLKPSVAEAKDSPVHILDCMGEEARSCTVFDCFGYEISDGGQVYILSSGVWYEVVSDFVTRTNDTIAKIGQPKLALPAWDGGSEAQYNNKCAADGYMLHCDAKNFRFGGGKSQFEFCDLVHIAGQTLFFAKIVSKSSGMSHLIEQVRCTAQLLFATDDGYRRELAKLFARHHPKADVSWLNTRPRQGDWNLCMVSLGRAAKDLPFFAKCGLAKVYKDLSTQGHAVSFTKV